MDAKFPSRAGRVQVYIDGQCVGKLLGRKGEYRLELLSGDRIGLWSYVDDAKRDIRARAAQVGAAAGLASAKAEMDRVVRARIDGIKARYEANANTFAGGVSCAEGGEVDQALRELGWALRDGRRYPSKVA